MKANIFPSYFNAAGNELIWDEVDAPSPPLTFRPSMLTDAPKYSEVETIALRLLKVQLERKRDPSSQ